MSGPKRNVAYIAQDEPTFLKQFKERIGYKEDPGIEAKRRRPAREGKFDGYEEDEGEDERPEADDDKPLVVVLRKGDLTAEEAEQYAAKEKDLNEDGPSDGRVMFKKPQKRSSTEVESSGVKLAGSKKAKLPSAQKRNAEEVDSNTAAKKISNSKLLSFAADEDNEEG